MEVQSGGFRHCGTDLKGICSHAKECEVNPITSKLLCTRRTRKNANIEDGRRSNTTETFGNLADIGTSCRKRSGVFLRGLVRWARPLARSPAPQICRSQLASLPIDRNRGVNRRGYLAASQLGFTRRHRENPGCTGIPESRISPGYPGTLWNLHPEPGYTRDTCTPASRVRSGRDA